MAFLFLFLGIVWMVNGVIVLLGASTSYERTIAISIVTLFCYSTRDPRRHSQHSLVLERKTARETLQLTTGSDCLPAPPDPKRGVTSDLVDSFFAWSERDSLAL